MLYLDHNKISNIQPFAFDGLVMLNYLDLRSNLLSDLGTNSLANLPNLERLYLVTNKIRTVAENAFNGTSSLTFVNFQSNDLTAIPPLGHQPHLSHIILEGNDIVDATFPPSFKTCSRITGIVLSSNKIKSLKSSTFQALANSRLAKLYLSGNAINSIDTGTFSGLRSLVSLKIGFNPLNSVTLKNAIAGLAGEDISSLDISGIELNGVLMEDTFSLLQNTELHSLKMKSNKIMIVHDNTFSQLNSLTMLDLSNSQINYARSHAFSGLEQLSTLKLNNNQLVLVPKNLPSSLNFLYLEKNQIHILENNAFENLAQLRVLRLSYNNILTLESGAFNGLANLEKLNLHHNRIYALPGSIFSSLVELKRLDLGKNNLRKIPYTKNIFSSLVVVTYLNLADNKCTFLQNDIFQPMISLKYLHLERNNLGKLLAEDHKRGIFEHLKNLEELYLMNNNIKALPGPMLKNQISLKRLNASNNKLTTWEPNLFKSSQKLVTLDLSYNLINTVVEKHIQYLTNLKYLNLTGSPFTCNCDLRWFRDWINQTKIVLSNNASYTCNGPRNWKGRPLLEFSRRKINCTFFSKYAIIGLVCAAMAVAFIICGLMYRIRWRLRLRWYRLSRRGRQFLKRTKTADGIRSYGAIEDDSKIFDAYVSCSESDRPWALRNLLPGIDSGQLNDNFKFEGDFHLYYEDRDSEPGMQKQICLYFVAKQLFCLACD